MQTVCLCSHSQAVKSEVLRRLLGDEIEIRVNRAVASALVDTRLHQLNRGEVVCHISLYKLLADQVIVAIDRLSFHGIRLLEGISSFDEIRGLVHELRPAKRSIIIIQSSMPLLPPTERCVYISASPGLGSIHNKRPPTTFM